MGYETEVEINRDKAKDHIKEAYSLINEVLVKETTGDREFADYYVDVLEEINAELRKIINKL